MDIMELTGCWHEAAHAVCAYNLGCRIDEIKINYREGDNLVSSVAYTPSTSPLVKDKEMLAIVRLMVTLAGQWGTALLEGKDVTANYYLRRGAVEDLRVIRIFAGRGWRDCMDDVNMFMRQYQHQVVALALYLETHDHVLEDEAIAVIHKATYLYG